MKMNITKALAVFRLLIWNAACMMDRPKEMGAQCLLQCLEVPAFELCFGSMRYMYTKEKQLRKENWQCLEVGAGQ